MSTWITRRGFWTFSSIAVPSLSPKSVLKSCSYFSPLHTTQTPSSFIRCLTLTRVNLTSLCMETNFGASPLIHRRSNLHQYCTDCIANVASNYLEIRNASCYDDWKSDAIHDKMQPSANAQSAPAHAFSAPSAFTSRLQTPQRPCPTYPSTNATQLQQSAHHLHHHRHLCIPSKTCIFHQQQRPCRSAIAWSYSVLVLPPCKGPNADASTIPSFDPEQLFVCSIPGRNRKL
jgi:hypothetical protein